MDFKLTMNASRPSYNRKGLVDNDHTDCGLLKSPSLPGCVISSGEKLLLRANQHEWFWTGIHFLQLLAFKTQEESSKKVKLTLTPTKRPRRVR